MCALTRVFKGPCIILNKSMSAILLKVVSGALGFFYLYQVEASFTLFRRLLFCNVPVDEILVREYHHFGVEHNKRCDQAISEQPLSRCRP